jgi:hypothetical protein
MQISVVEPVPDVCIPPDVFVELKLCGVFMTLAMAALLAAISAKPPAILAIEVIEVFICVSLF